MNTNKTTKYALVDHCYQDFMQDELRNTDFIESIIESINNKSNHHPSQRHGWYMCSTNNDGFLLQSSQCF